MAKIIARGFPVLVAGTHLYYEFVDDLGNRIAQVNGLTLDRDTNRFVPVGGLLDGDDSIRIHITENAYLSGTSDLSVGVRHTVFEGSEAAVRRALDYVQEIGNYINAQDLDYTPIPALSIDKYNSNSAFVGISKAIVAALPSINVPELENFWDSLGAFGVGNDILQGKTWAPRLDFDWNITGSIVNDSSATDRLIGASGHDVLFGLDGQDDIFAGGGNDEIHAGADADRAYGQTGNDIFYAGWTLEGLEGDIYFGGDLANWHTETSGQKGYDTVDYSGLRVGYGLSFSMAGLAGTVRRADAPATPADQLRSIEHLIGTDFNDTFAVDTYVRSIKTGRGNDTVTINPVVGQSLRKVESVTYTGGIDVINASGATAANVSPDTSIDPSLRRLNALVFGPGISMGDLSFREIVHGIENGIGKYARYFDLEITVSGHGSVTLTNLVKRIFYGGALDLFFGPTMALSDGTLINTSADGYGSTSPSGAINGTNGDDIIDGSIGEDAIYAFGGDDILRGGLANDFLNGGDGNDSYIYGGGFDGIIEGGGDEDKIIFDASFEQSRFSLELVNPFSPGHLRVLYDGVPVAFIYGHFASEERAVESIEIYGGGSISLTEAVYEQIGTESGDVLFGIRHGGSIDNVISGLGGRDTIFGYDGNDTLNGGDGGDALQEESGSNILNGGKGDDYINGGVDSDLYVYNQGDGLDFILDPDGIDTVRLGPGITPSSIFLDRQNNQGLRISVDGSPAIEIDSFFSEYSDRHRLEYLEFSDGTSTNLSALRNVIGTEGNDILNGLDRSLMKADRIVGGDGDDIINGKSGDDWLEGGSGIDTINGGSGDDKIGGSSDNDILNGDSGDDLLKGEWGDDTLKGGTGNDVLKGGDGSDKYYYFSGDGLDIIEDSSYFSETETDSVYFGEGFVNSDMRLVRVGQYDLAIEFGSVRRILIQDQFHGGTGIEHVHLSDGAIVNLTTWSHRVDGTEGNETLYGTDAGAGPDKIYGYGGNDTVHAYAGDDYLIGGAGDDTLYGGLGDDRYIYNSGVDIIRDDGGNDRIDLGAGITQANLTWQRDGDYGLDMFINGVLAIKLDSQFLLQNSGIERVRFNDSSSLYTSSLQFTASGTSDDDHLYGISFGANPDDILNGLGGNDSLWGGLGNDTINGGAGNDTLSGEDGDDVYRINLGEGVDTITDTSGNDKIIFGTGIEQSSIEMVRDSANKSNLKILLNNNLVAIFKYHFQQYYETGSLETIQFHNGSTIDLLSTVFVQTGIDNTDYLDGYIGKDRLIGNGGDDHIQGFGGDDLLEGGAGNDYLYGGTGNDSFVYTGGSDYVVESNNEGTDTVSVGFTPSQIWSWADNSNFYIQSISNPDDVLKISGSLGYAIGGFGFDVGQRLETVTFSNGVVWNLAAGLTMNDSDEAHYLYGSPQADTIDGNGGSDTLYGSDGNDLLYGGNGTDYLYGGEGDDRLYGENDGDYLIGDAGKDWIRGGAGDDQLYGGTGNDSLIGDAGIDALYGDAGADKFVFYAASAFSEIDTIHGFSLAEGDKLDVRDLLIGFDPLTKLVTDFVQITDSTGSSVVKIDRDGIGGANTFAQIATIQSVTGLTDEQALMNAGALITA